jgi:hypothetical protein
MRTTALKRSKKFHSNQVGPAWLLLLLVLALNCLCLGFTLLLQATPPGSRWLPGRVLSLLQADYSADREGRRYPVVRLGVIDDALRDQRTPLPDNAYQDIIRRMQTPVPTVAHLPDILPNPTDSALSTGTSTPEPLFTEIPMRESATSEIYTHTPSPDPSAQTTATSTPRATNTPRRAVTSTPTLRPVSTSTLTRTHAPTPTRTPTQPPYPGPGPTPYP